MVVVERMRGTKMKSREQIGREKNSEIVIEVVKRIVTHNREEKRILRVIKDFGGKIAREKNSRGEKHKEEKTMIQTR